jgi:phosphate starvation-inducible membrane PsiE
MNKFILFISVLSYSIVASQSFMYILALKNTQQALGASSYIEVRQLIDANMQGIFKYVIYVALLSSISLILVNYKTPTSFLFISSVIAFVALVIDVLLMLKGSMPLNQVINSWSPEHYPSDWKSVRAAWFNVLYYRQIANISGFTILLAGVIFRSK